MSDEDGHIAMCKDSGRIGDSCVKLLLSSRVEMQHAVEKVRKINNDKSRSVNKYHQRSWSPNGEQTYRSRSPSRCSSFEQSLPESKTYNLSKSSVSPNYSQFAHEMGSHYKVKKSLEHSKSDCKVVTIEEVQAELEKRVTDELLKHNHFKMIMDEDISVTEYNIPDLDKNVGKNVSFGSEENYFQRYPPTNVHDNLMSTTIDICQVQASIPGPSNSNPDLPELLSPREMCSLDQPKIFNSKNDKTKKQIIEGFFVKLSGLDCSWKFPEVQQMLKGTFVPPYHIKFGKSEEMLKKGVVIVKLLNKEAFDEVLQKKLISFHGRKIRVSECSSSLSSIYFPSRFKFEENSYCYSLKGLPPICTYNDIVNFFPGFQIADVRLIYNENGQVRDLGFVSFANKNDFEAALSRNGNKIQSRFIQMMPCTQKEMVECKIAPKHPFTSHIKPISKKILPVTQRPLCAKITGLRTGTTMRKVRKALEAFSVEFWAIHLPCLNPRLTQFKTKTDGRALIEFTNIVDCDRVLKLHGKKFLGSLVTVKKISYDKMVRILDSQRAKHYFTSSGFCISL